MPEWWTYSLADFLMFAPRTYWRLLELYNADVWPVHFAALVAGMVLLVLAGRDEIAARRASALLVAVAWAWVAWGWLHLRFATINWAADYAAAAFACETALWAAYAWQAHALAPVLRAPAVHIGGALVAFAVVVYPFAGRLAGHTIAGVELFGLMPDPTAMATLGLLVAAPRPARWVLMPIPLATCAFAGAMLWVLGDLRWWMPLAAALVALGAPLVQRRRMISRSSDSRSF